MTEHTKTPWRVDDEDCDRIVTDYTPDRPRTYGYGCGNDFIADLDDGEYHNYKSQEEKRANARFIVRACSNHYELVATCKFILDGLESLYPIGDRDYDRDVDNMIEKLKSLLSKLEAEDGK